MVTLPYGYEKEQCHDMLIQLDLRVLTLLVAIRVAKLLHSSE